MLKKNLIANLIGGTWIAVLTLVITPLQVHILGIEAYGLVSLIAILQVVLGSLDFGLSSSITRTVSAERSKSESTRDLVNSAATLYWMLALLIVLVLWFGSDWLASNWFKPTKLDADTVSMGVKLIAVYLALRWPVAFYTGLINGLQRMDILNMIKSGTVSVRLLGGILVLMIAPKISAFLMWFILSAILEVIIYIKVVNNIYREAPIRLFFSYDSVKKIWKFSFAMASIGLMSTLVTQLDRAMVSKFLSLEDLGYYALAYNVAIGISLLQTAINNASFPAFSEAYGGNNYNDLLRRYNKTSQLMGYLSLVPCLILIFYGNEFLAWWVSADAAHGAYIPMAFLAFGFYLSAMVSSSYIMSIAHAKPSVALKINAVGLIFYVPMLYWLTNQVGINGAAGCWLVLNVYYLITLFPRVQIHILNQHVWPWLKVNMLQFLILGLLVFGTINVFVSTLQQAWITWIALITSVAIYALLGFKMLSKELSSDLLGLLKLLARALP